MADEIRATPRNSLAALLSDAIQGGVGYMKSPKRTQQLQGLGRLIESTGIPYTAQSLSYDPSGRGLFTGAGGLGGTTRMRPEALEAAMTVAPIGGPANRGLMQATKGLPVGASIKPINLNKALYKSDLTMEEMLKVRDIPTVDRVRQSIDLVGEKEFEKMVNAQYLKYKPTSSEQEAMLVESVTLDILGKAQRSPYPQQAALETAQRNAALPVEQGGLGLPPNNTAEMRAKAMGFDTDVYHGTNQNFRLFSTDQATFAAENPSVANLYGRSLKNNADIGQNILPLKIRGNQLTVSDLGNDGSTGRFANNVARELRIPRKELEDLRMPNPQFNDSYLESLQSLLLKRFGDPRISDVGERTIVNRLPEFGVDRLKVTDMSDMGGIQTQYMLPAGSDNIRSRFAAFDPMRRTVAIAASMGLAAPDLLANQMPMSPMYQDPFPDTTR